MYTKKIGKNVGRLGISLGVVLVGYAVTLILPWASTDQEITFEPAGLSSVNNLQKIYDKWSTTYATSEPVGPVLTMLWTRGFSSEFSPAKGIAQLDLKRNTVSVRIDNLSDTEISDVWLVDNQPGFGRSAIPEEGDNLVKIGRLKFEEGNNNAWLDAKVENLANFQLDMIVLARKDGSPGKEGVLYGTTSLFQKVFHYPEHKAAPKQTAFKGNPLISNANATGITPPYFFPDFDSNLLNKGRDLFFNETFNGNGRSCGTCHHEDDNMALSLKTIAKLPADDPLFIVEQEYRQDGSLNPLFGDFRMEKPILMRKAGLILENLNGFKELNGDFTTRVNMRAPNHVLSLRTTLAPPPVFADDGTLPVDVNDLVFAERTGWGGDGTPTGFRQDFFDSNGRDLTGSLRDFIVGAVVQHYPLTLERSAFNEDEYGNPRTPDFRFPTEQELNAIEAFMLSIGRQEENDDLSTISLSDELADRGRLNYMGFNVFDSTPTDGRPPLNCNSCHFNGGSNTDPTFPFIAGVSPNHDLADLAANGGAIPSHNRSFGPQVERLADQAGDVLVQTVDDPSVAGNCFTNGLAEVPLLPGDGPGLGPSAGCDANPFDNGFAFDFGDQFADLRVAGNRFNVPVVFEAADNAPFFHGHQINTIEGAVAFYATNRHLRNGDFLGAIVPLNGSQVDNVARFIRVMGADFNVTSAIQLLKKAKNLHKRRDRRINAKLAQAETIDAIELLNPVDLHIQDAVPLLRKASKILKRISRNGNRHLLQQGINVLKDVQAAMVTRGV
ncbi:MAG: hypothetical protein GXP08_13495 [Gammaproteobacteria bacterium]|nr:hypothetical protein [Gammaproteobacteria bacterium]